MGAPSRKGRRRKRGRGKKRRTPSRLRRILFRGLRLFLLILVPTLLLSVVWIDRTVSRRFEERTNTFPSRVYAAPWTLERGDRLDPDELAGELESLGYRR